MSKQARTALLKYWGYSSFRPLQEEIVDAVIAGEDTMALLPTGGGKSICFQVPSMVMEGMCLVITPLIALMKDQVQHLKKIGIPAAAIYSGMHYNEIELAYNQAVFNRLKFLYISPERLATDRFVETLRRMKINLLAIDESHCISQWGYDFRPPYLNIADIRPYLPKVPVLALTATATPEVVEDIQEKLHFRKKNVFQTSYERKNITYNLISDADKFGTLFRLFRQLKQGSGIVYVRNRKRTREIADWLSNKGISATYYHAGLEARMRDQRQQSWMRGKHQVMVSTNAFGMGIDKPDVRLVVHVDLPDSLEAYFQEAGRAGRDGHNAATYLIVSENDVKQLKSSFESTFPPMKQIKLIYEAMGNYLQIPVGAGKDQSFDFDLVQFSRVYKYQLLEVFNSLRLLEKEGIIAMTESMSAPSKVFVKANREDLY
ncbi:MAG: ATP-dependent DNA helicase, partial [Bacteroidales bacterium]|nr:ATP-dependent DNA helicase [Bacteroidales bacterium]